MNRFDSPVLNEATRKFHVEEIARIYGVPAPLIGDTSSGTWGAGIRALAEQGYRFGFQQHINRLLSAFSAVLLPANYRFEVDTVGLLLGDPDKQAALITALEGDAQRPPLATVNELRSMAGLSIERGKDEFVSVLPPNETENEMTDNEAQD